MTWIQSTHILVLHSSYKDIWWLLKNYWTLPRISLTFQIRLSLTTIKHSAAQTIESFYEVCKNSRNVTPGTTSMKKWSSCLSMQEWCLYEHLISSVDFSAVLHVVRYVILYIISALISSHAIQFCVYFWTEEMYMDIS